MKINSLDALVDLLERLPTSEREDQRGAVHERLQAFEPRKYQDTIAGKTVAALGTEPILHMRAFSKTGKLSEALLADMRGRVRA